MTLSQAGEVTLGRNFCGKKFQLKTSVFAEKNKWTEIVWIDFETENSQSNNFPQTAGVYIKKKLFIAATKLYC